MGKKKEMTVTSVIRSEVGAVTLLLSITVIFRIIINAPELSESPSAECWYRVLNLGVTLSLMALSVYAYFYAKSSEEVGLREIIHPHDVLFVFVLCLGVVLSQRFWFRPDYVGSQSTAGNPWANWGLGLGLPNGLGFWAIAYVFRNAKITRKIPREKEK